MLIQVHQTTGHVTRSICEHGWLPKSKWSRARKTRKTSPTSTAAITSKLHPEKTDHE